MPPPKRSGAGSLNERVRFQRRQDVQDEFGNVKSTWIDQFEAAARLTPRLGGEEVMAGRLQGTQPYILRVRGCSDVRCVTPEWRAVHARSGAVYNIRSISNPDERGAYFDMLVVQGGAT